MAIPGRYHDSWINRNGPGDARPTALQIIKDEDLVGKLVGKTAVITGCSSGIGVEAARALHATGATVIATARNASKLLEVIKEIEDGDPANKAPIVPVIMDLVSLKSVREGAKTILEKSGGKINILITNAGVMATPRGRTEDGFETQFGTNHLAHFLLFLLLKDAMLAASTPEFNSRVVSVASIGHRRSSVLLDDYYAEFDLSEYDPWVAYGQSKTANIWMANEIDRRYGSKGLHALSLHPGGIETGLMKHTDRSSLVAWIAPGTEKYFKNVAQGAATEVYAAVSKDWEGKGGKWLSNCEEWGPEDRTAGDGDPLSNVGDDGHAEYAFDVKGAQTLWKDSLKMVGMTEDEEDTKAGATQ